MKTALIIFALCSLGASAQQVQKVFQLKYADANQVKQLLSAFPAAISLNGNLHMIAVNGNKEAVDTIEEALKKIDVPEAPRPDIEVSGYIVLASLQPAVSSEPAELAGVIKQLRALFPYKSYRVAETLYVRGRDGQHSGSGGFIAEEPNAQRQYEFKYRASIGGDKLIRLDDVYLQIHSPNNLPMVRLSTDIDIHEGQKVVVGKSNINGADTALILVLSAKVVD
jgi:hypothetical protein